MLGAVMLGGWVFDINALKNFAPGAVRMKVNTAAGLLLSGIVLGLLLRRTTAKKIWIVTATASILIFIVGAMTLCENMFSWDLRIDQILFHDSTGAESSLEPGRMSPSSAICFLFVGVAFFVASQSWWARPRIPIISAVAMVIISIGAMALAGHFTGALLSVRWWHYAGMAVPTAAGFIMLGFGLLAMLHREAGLTWWLDNSPPVDM